MPYARRRTYRRKTTGRYRRRGAIRRVMRGINYYNNPLKLLKLQRHYHGNDGYTSFKQRINRYRSSSRGGKDLPPRNPLSKPPNDTFEDLDEIPLQERDVNEVLGMLEQMEREANSSKSTTFQKAARFGLDTVGRNIRAVVKSLPILKDFSFLGDPAYSFFNFLGSKISDEKFMGDNNAENALLSFVDGEDRPGSVNKYTDKIGELFASLAGNPELVEGLTGNFKSMLLDGINNNPAAKEYYDWKIKGIQPNMLSNYPDQRVYLEPDGESNFFQKWQEFNPDFAPNAWDVDPIGFGKKMFGEDPYGYKGQEYLQPPSDVETYRRLARLSDLPELEFYKHYKGIGRPTEDYFPSGDMLSRIAARRERLKELKADPVLNFDISGTGFTPKSRRPKPNLSPIKLRKRKNLF